MSSLRILVVFYSRTGITRRCAEAISAVLRRDIEEILDTKNRNGALGYLKSGVDAIFRRHTII